MKNKLSLQKTCCMRYKWSNAITSPNGIFLCIDHWHTYNIFNLTYMKLYFLPLLSRWNIHSLNITNFICFIISCGFWVTVLEGIVVHKHTHLCSKYFPVFVVLYVLKKKSKFPFPFILKQIHLQNNLWHTIIHLYDDKISTCSTGGI